MKTLSLTLSPGLVRVLHAVFATVLDGEQPIAQITLACDDDQPIEIILSTEVRDGDQ